MNNPFDQLLTPITKRTDPWQFATVTAVSPLRIRLDSDTTPLPLSPIDLGGPRAVGDRVYVHFLQDPGTDRRSARMVIIGPSTGGTGWQPHGGTLAAGVVERSPIQWRIVNGFVWWRGQISKTGGWTLSTANPIITNIPAAIRPAGDYNTPLATSVDGTAQASVLINDQGTMNLYTGFAAGWPSIGGGYPVA